MQCRTLPALSFVRRGVQDSSVGGASLSAGAGGLAGFDGLAIALAKTSRRSSRFPPDQLRVSVGFLKGRGFRFLCFWLLIVSAVLRGEGEGVNERLAG